MSFVVEQAMELEDEALAAAFKSKALLPCPVHSDGYYRAEDDDAERLAYAIATKRWKTGELMCDREQLMDAVKDAIEMAPEDCPECAAHFDD